VAAPLTLTATLSSQDNHPRVAAYLAKKEKTLDRPLSAHLQQEVIRAAAKSHEYRLTNFRANLNKTLGAAEGGSRKCPVAWGREGGEGAWTPTRFQSLLLSAERPVENVPLPSIEPDSEESCILPSALLLGLLGSLVTPTALQMMKDDYKRYLPCAILFFLHVGPLVA